MQVLIKQPYKNHSKHCSPKQYYLLKKIKKRRILNSNSLQ